MKKLISQFIIFCIAISTLVFIGCGTKNQLPDNSKLRQIGSWYIAARLNPDPPREKGNQLILWVLDSDKQPVNGAEISLDFVMPAMGSMPEMRGSGKTEESGNGQYNTAFDLQMKGSWNITINIQTATDKASLSGSITTGVEGFVFSGTGSENVNNSNEEGSSLNLPEIKKMMEISDRIREELALDRTDSLATLINSFQEQVLTSEKNPEFNTSITKLLKNLQVTLSNMKNHIEDKDFTELRIIFGNLSESLVSIMSQSSELQSDWHLFSCPMADGYGKWIQKDSEPRNPYMGQKMLKCHSKESWPAKNIDSSADENAQDHEGHDHGDEIAYYTCSMHPSVKDKNPGTCPICSMDLMPVKKEELKTGMILVDELRRQRIGVKIEKVRISPIKSTIRAVGHVEYDETRIQDITLRVEGWIEKLNADRTGMYIGKNSPLATIYSPQLLAAQEEFLQMKRAQNKILVESARERLHLLGLSRSQVENLEKRGKAENTVSILAPISGHVVTKTVVAGSHLSSGKRLFQLAPLDVVWVEAEVYEADLPYIKKGMKADISLTQIPGEEFTGKVSFIYPYLEGNTRNGKIRIHLRNPNGKLRPGMYANVSLSLEKNEILQVPVSAVVYTGPNRLVFVDKGEGRLVPKVIQIGRKYGENFEVLSGLNEGDEVVTSGNFLVAAESRIRSAASYWGGNIDE